MRLPYLGTDNRGVLIHEQAALTSKVRERERAGRTDLELGLYHFVHRNIIAPSGVERCIGEVRRSLFLGAVRASVRACEICRPTRTVCLST